MIACNCLGGVANVTSELFARWCSHPYLHSTVFSLLLFSFRLLSRLLRLCVFAPVQNDDNWRHFVKYDSGGEATSGLSGDCSTTLSRRHIGNSVYAWTMVSLAVLLRQDLPFFCVFLHKSANFWPLSHRSRSSQSKGIFMPLWKLLILKKC